MRQRERHKPQQIHRESRHQATADYVPYASAICVALAPDAFAAANVAPTEGGPDPDSARLVEINATIASLTVESDEIKRRQAADKAQLLERVRRLRARVDAELGWAENSERVETLFDELCKWEEAGTIIAKVGGADADGTQNSNCKESPQRVEVVRLIAPWDVAKGAKSCALFLIRQN